MSRKPLTTIVHGNIAAAWKADTFPLTLCLSTPGVFARRLFFLPPSGQPTGAGLSLYHAVAKKTSGEIG